MTTTRGPPKTKKHQARQNKHTEVAKLEDDPATILEALRAKLAVVRSLCESVERVRMGDWQSVKDQIETALQELQAAVDGGEEAVQAMCFLLNQSRKQEKSSRNAALYRRAKVQKRLSAGGWGKHAAKDGL